MKASNGGEGAVARPAEREGAPEDPVVAALFAGPLAVALVDEQLALVRVSAGLLALEGCAAAPRTLGELTPGLSGLVDPLVRGVLADGVPVVRRPLERATTCTRPSRRLLASVQLLGGAPRRALLVLEDDTPRARAEALLDEAESLAGVGTWEFDVQSNRTTWSNETHRLFGQQVGTFHGSFEEYLALLPPADRPRVEAILARAFETGEAVQFEHGVLDGGAARVIECRARVERDPAGRPLRMAGTALDVTQRKRADEEHRFLHAIVEHLPNMIFVKEAKELRFVRFNRAGEELLGYSRETLIGKNDHDFFPPEEANQFVSQDRRVLGSRQPLVCPDEPIHTRDKGVRMLHSTKVPILGADGEPAYLLGISEDVTERRRAESFRLSDLLVQSMVDYAVFLVDAQGNVQSWNAGAERVTGYTADEIVGRSIAILRDGDSGPEPTALLGRAAAGRVVEEGPWRRKDGRTIWRTTEVTPIRDARGQATLFGTVTRDITAKKRAEDEREQLLAQLREALRLRDEFLSVASHELRTPVTTLRLQAELLDQLGALQPPDLLARLRLLTDKIVRQTERLERHVAGLLDVTRLTAGRIDLRLAPTDLGQLAEAVVARCREELHGTPELRLASTPDVVGNWDALRVDQVLTNLLSNAVKYGGGKPIEVRVEATADEARLSVTDHGIGIAPADQERIFLQFERAVSERNYGGLGLGLFIVRQIVEAMGGTISVASAPGEGATFLVRLPRGPRSDDPGRR